MAKVFTIFNDRIELEITNYGGRVMRWKVDGVDIVFGFNTIAEYKVAKEPYHSALIGRYANRIANAKFSINTNSYQLRPNLNAHILHGGPSAFHNVFWTVLNSSETHLELQYISPDGDQGFPGELITVAKYTLNGDELLLEMTAKSTKPTPVSFTHHPYFNLSGLDSQDLSKHTFKIHSESILPTNAEGIPLGSKLNIAQTAFDFQNWKLLYQEGEKPHDQIDLLGGIDHSYVFDEFSSDMIIQAEAKSEVSNIHMKVFSNQPALQFYTANHFDGSEVGKADRQHRYRGAFCFEPQGYPDSPNHLNFPSCILDPKEQFSFKMKYKFPLLKRVSK